MHHRDDEERVAGISHTGEGVVPDISLGTPNQSTQIDLPGEEGSENAKDTTGLQQTRLRRTGGGRVVVSQSESQEGKV